MNLLSACLGTLLRTVVICLVAWPICVGIERWIRGISDRTRPFVLGLVLAPCLFPELVVGYAYRDLALTSPQVAELMCLGLLLIRIVPVGIVTLLASPLSLADLAATHCRWLLLSANPGSIRDAWQWWLCLWHGPIRRVLPALGLMSLVAFQEFELAALLQAASWTDWFIAAQRVGLNREEMLRQALLPILIQMPLLTAVVCWTVKFRDSSIEMGDERPLRGMAAFATTVYLAASLFVGCLVPLGIMGTNLLSGLTMIIRQPTQLSGIVQEMGISAAISLCAGLATWSASRWFLRSNGGGPVSLWIRRSLLLPGLAGSLLLSLASGLLFQQPWLRPLYDTPLPWVLALIVWLLPRAVLVRLWLDSVSQSDAIHLAEMLAKSDAGASRSHHHSRLLFRLRDQPRLLAMSLLCYWAYLDLSTAYLLAPSGMPSGLVRLYNFMHFGRSSALSAEALLFFGGPLVAIGFVFLAFRFVQRP